MLRTLSTVSAHTFARGVRTRRAAEGRLSRAFKLRLDTLETREQPGSVLNGLAAGLVGGGMLEPLAIMASVVGPNSLSTEPAPVEALTRTSEKAEPQVGALPPTTEATPTRPTEVRGSGEAAGTITAASNVPSIDVSDLSIDDVSQFDVPLLHPASAGESGGSSASAGG